MSEIRPEQIVLATDVYLGGWARSYQTAKKTTDPNATFYFTDDEDISPLVAHQTRVGQGKNTPGKRFKLFLVEADDDEQEPEAAAAPRRYGQQARELKLSSFFRAPEVWKVLGTDAEFRAWVTRQPSILSGGFNEYDDAGDGRCVACHVRRAGESGTGYKAEYACVPMTDAEHRDQHAYSEHECLFRHRKNDPAPDRQEAKEWFDQKRIETVQAWAWETLKKQLGFESMAAVPPDTIFQWAESEGVERYLPECYREVL